MRLTQGVPHYRTTEMLRGKLAVFKGGFRFTVGSQSRATFAGRTFEALYSLSVARSFARPANLAKLRFFCDHTFDASFGDPALEFDECALG
jgi:hypothetical protein